MPDPSGRPPLCDKAEFAESLEGMVADAAPRLFAVVQEYGEWMDGRIAAWGMAFDDHVEVVGIGDGNRMSLLAPDRALHAYAWGRHIHTRLVWFNAEAATRSDDE